MLKNKRQVGRFGLVGIINTALDIGILFVLKSLGVPVSYANVVSTSVAFCFSFFANKLYTFNGREGNVVRQMTLFIVVTLFGLWVLQTIVIQLTLPLWGTLFSNGQLALLAAKLAATIVSLSWNYTLYEKLVFAKKEP
ncbi:GtrA family protein [Candidatus Saccharibacteria bacterium]|nr:MAG: GtrA family protein [Candidatus Saccharibacteria bacterium]QQS68902.1 MAG: GtrA family protein [Candidatus Saccharibacteria bacterium]